MKPRLVAIDLDGTLLPATKDLTPRARAAVRAAERAGARVVLATGKTFHLTARYAAELGLAGPAIVLDGAVVRDVPGEETFVSEGVPADEAIAAVERLDDLDLRPFLTDGRDRLLLHDGLSDWLDFLRVYGDRIDLTPAPAEDARGDPHFLAFLGPHDAVRRGEEILRAHLTDGLRVFAAEFDMRDIGLLVLRPGVDKGTALAATAERLGIPREETAAVGDWRNDTAMVAWAGTGVAMADAHPEVMAVADAVLPGSCEDDAVAVWLEDLYGSVSGTHGGT